MKRILYILAVILVGTLSVKANNNFIDKFANQTGVTYVNISKTLLQLMPEGKMKTEGLNLSLIINELDRVQILSCEREENPAAYQQMQKESSYFQKAPYEELMRVKDDEELVTFYVQPSTNQKIKELVMLMNEPDEFTLIRLLGNISISNLKGLTQGVQ